MYLQKLRHLSGLFTYSKSGISNEAVQIALETFKNNSLIKITEGGRYHLYHLEGIAITHKCDELLI